MLSEVSMGLAEAFKSLIEFFLDKNNYNLVKENWLTFLLFAIIILILALSAFAIFCKIHYKGFSEYKNLKKDYEELEKDYEELKKDNESKKEEIASLSEKIRNLTTDNRMLDHIHSNSSSGTIGEKIFASI